MIAVRKGCRLPWGRGKVLPGVMALSHRWLGNPLLSRLTRWMFHAPIHDVYCGMRGFTKELYARLDQRCTGMEFATEMIIEGSIDGAKISEILITLHPDGRKSHSPHLRTVRDGWRTLRFFLIYSPRWLFLVPGALLVLRGLIGYGIVMPGVTLRGVTFDAHTLLFARLAILCGYQAILFAIFTKVFAISEGLKRKPLAEICTEHQISPSQYYQWRDQFLAHVSKAFEVHHDRQKEARDER
jgi:hypothetical protein